MLCVLHWYAGVVIEHISALPPVVQLIKYGEKMKADKITLSMGTESVLGQETRNVRDYYQINMR